MKRKHTPASEFSAGHFTELVAKHNWPPRFDPLMAEFARRVSK